VVCCHWCPLKLESLRQACWEDTSSSAWSTRTQCLLAARLNPAPPPPIILPFNQIQTRSGPPFTIPQQLPQSWHDFPGDGGAEIYLLQWIYGNVAHAPTEDLLERQRLAAGTKGCDVAVMDCLAELADVWRQLAGATARKRHLQSLRDGVREESAAVRSYEESGAAALCTQVSHERQRQSGVAGSGWRGGGG
jgi:hypothetical protein